MRPLKDETFVVIDVATTGFRPEADEPVEISAVKIKKGEIIAHDTWRVKPSVKIPPAASAHHELRDKDVANSPALSEVQADIEKFVGDNTIIMHNTAVGESLDKAMLPFLHDRTWICNARLSKHMWPQLTESEKGFPLANHDVWTLTYWLDKPGLNQLDSQVYETKACAAATAHVFNQALGLYLENGNEPTVEALYEFTEQPVKLAMMPRGMYKNVCMTELPQSYFKTLLSEIRTTEETLDRDYVHTIEQEASRRIEDMYGYKGGVRKFK